MIEPEGPTAQTLLDLLATMGLQGSVIVAIGTAIALFQWFREVDESGHLIEANAMTMLRGQPRLVRAYALFALSHTIATGLSISLLTQLLRSPPILYAINISANDTRIKVSAGVAAYFLIVDWWSLHRGDTLPTFLAAAAGIAGGSLLLTTVIRSSALTSNWWSMVPWLLAAVVWFRSLTWATYRASALARALQGG
jgi:hypothetical protein